MKFTGTNIVLFAIIGLLAVLNVGSYYLGYNRSEHHFSDYMNDFKPIRKGGERYKYINPLVGTDSPNAFDVGYHTDVRDDLLDIITEYKAKGLVDYAIYYRELNSSVWFGINHEAEFFPASLLKITIALATYKQGETNIGYLDSYVTYTQAIKNESLSRVNEETTLVVGESYKIRDLIETMLVASDNGARDLLASTISEKHVTELYSYLNVAEPSPVMNFRISVENYALFFRLLYSSTFINEDHSEELLKILTKTNFPFGLVRDLPSDIPAAHKFGVFNLPKNSAGLEMQELHDCGIVYQLDKPYLLCIMTEGSEQAVLADFIARVSKRIFKFSLG